MSIKSVLIMVVGLFFFLSACAEKKAEMETKEISPPVQLSDQEIYNKPAAPFTSLEEAEDWVFSEGMDSGYFPTLLVSDENIVILGVGDKIRVSIYTKGDGYSFLFEAQGEPAVLVDDFELLQVIMRNHSYHQK